MIKRGEFLLPEIPYNLKLMGKLNGRIYLLVADLYNMEVLWVWLTTKDIFRRDYND